MKSLIRCLMLIVVLSTSCWGQEWILTDYVIGQNQNSTVVSYSQSSALFSVSGVPDTSPPPVFHVEYLYSLPLTEVTSKMYLSGTFFIEDSTQNDDSTVVWWGVVSENGERAYPWQGVSQPLSNVDVRDSMPLTAALAGTGIKKIKGVLVVFSVYNTTRKVNKKIMMENFYIGDSNITGIKENVVKASSGFKLNQNYPNPFNPTTTIRYSIPKTSFVTIKVYNVLGEEEATLVNEERNAGNYRTEFNAGNLPSGTYFYRLQAGSFVETKKMILLK